MRSSIVIGCVALGTLFASSTELRGAEPEPETFGNEVVTGPCADFIKGVCAKAGDTSELCRSVKQVSAILPPAACQVANSQMKYSLDRIDVSRKSCGKLVTDLCRDLGPDTETCKMVETQTKNFPAERCTTLLGRYSDVLVELKKMEAANKPLDVTKRTKISAGAGPSFGPIGAKVTLVEFADFQCPFSSRAATVVRKIRANYATKVHFVYRQFPLSFHQNAHSAAEASLAAHAQGKFWEFHDTLFENQKELERAALEKYAKQVGLNIARFTKALDKKEFAKTVDADLTLGNEVAVSGTPTLFINGKRVQNATDYDAVAKLIDEALATP